MLMGSSRVESIGDEVGSKNEGVGKVLFVGKMVLKMAEIGN